VKRDGQYLPVRSLHRLYPRGWQVRESEGSTDGQPVLFLKIVIDD
jgi:hypothetical protein